MTAVQTPPGKFCQVVGNGVGVVSDGPGGTSGNPPPQGPYGPPCPFIDGTAANFAACTCGTTTPAAAPAQRFCQVVNGVGYVSDTIKCWNTDGTAAASVACTCGTTTAVQTPPGKFCQVVGNGVGVVSDTVNNVFQPSQPSPYPPSPPSPYPPSPNIIWQYQHDILDRGTRWKCRCCAGSKRCLEGEYDGTQLYGLRDNQNCQVCMCAKE